MKKYDKKLVKGFSIIKTNKNNKIKADLNLYETLLKIQSPSSEEDDMILFIKDYIKTNHKDVAIEEDSYNNLYITKGIIKDEEYYPCLVAHMDEVHDKNPDRIITRIGDFYMGWCNRLGCQEGIGADDANGIFVALSLLNHFDKLKIFLSTEEEIGGRGTRNCDLTWFNDIGYLIQCDRRGHDDFITYSNGREITSFEFCLAVDDVLSDYSYTEAVGTFTDVGVLVSRNVGVSACNISCGYYDEHYDEETTHIPSLINCLNLAYHMIHICKYSKYILEPEEPITSKYTDRYDFDWGDKQLDLNELYELDKLFDDYNYGPCVDCKKLDCSNCEKFNE